MKKFVFLFTVMLAFVKAAHAERRCEPRDFKFLDRTLNELKNDRTAAKSQTENATKVLEMLAAEDPDLRCSMFEAYGGLVYLIDSRMIDISINYLGTKIETVAIVKR